MDFASKQAWFDILQGEVVHRLEAARPSSHQPRNLCVASESARARRNMFVYHASFRDTMPTAARGGRAMTWRS